MGRKNKVKEGREYFIVDRAKTKSIESGVILILEAMASQNNISPRTLIEKIVEKRDEKGDYLEFISKKNKAGQRIHVLERKYLMPEKTHSFDDIEPLLEEGKFYPRWETFSNRNYEFYIEQNGRIAQGDFFDSNSKDLENRMRCMLLSYKNNLDCKKT